MKKLNILLTASAVWVFIPSANAMETNHPVEPHSIAHQAPVGKFGMEDPASETGKLYQKALLEEYNEYGNRLMKAALPCRTEKDDFWLRLEREQLTSSAIRTGTLPKEYLDAFPEVMDGPFYREINVHHTLTLYSEAFKEDPRFFGYPKEWVLEVPLKKGRFSDFMVKSLLHNKVQKLLIKQDEVRKQVAHQ